MIAPATSGRVLGFMRRTVRALRSTTTTELFYEAAFNRLSFSPTRSAFDAAEERASSNA